MTIVPVWHQHPCRVTMAECHLSLYPHQYLPPPRTPCAFPKVTPPTQRHPPQIRSIPTTWSATRATVLGCIRSPDVEKLRLKLVTVVGICSTPLSGSSLLALPLFSPSSFATWSAPTSAKQPRSLTQTKNGHLATSRQCLSPRSPITWGTQYEYNYKQLLAGYGCKSQPAVIVCEPFHFGDWAELVELQYRRS